MNGFSLRDLAAAVGIVAASFLIGAVTSSLTRSDTTSTARLTPEDWLLAAPSDQERFRRLQTQLRGLDQPMWEVGERFRRLHEALTRRNYDLALYHLQKIETTISNGIVKRPARAASAEAMFLGRTVAVVRAGIRTRMPDAAWDAFGRTKAACLGCHEVEHVPYVNQQPLFDLGPPGPPQSPGSK